MLNLVEFDAWIENNNFLEKTKKEIERIRSAPPSRRVGGGKNNVSGRFSSNKMGVTIQFESHKVELSGVYLMEHDDNVLEYYDQPPILKLPYYTGKNGNKIPINKTPDFFVIEKSKAYWVEWKTEKELIKLSQKNPERYYKENGNWVFAPGKEYAEELGLEFIVRSSDEIDWIAIRNIKYLEDYIIREYDIENSKIEKIKEVITKFPGITLKELIESAEGEYSIDDIYALIVKKVIFVDIYTALLREPENVKIFLNNEQSKSLSILESSKMKVKKANVIEMSSGNKVLWGGDIWTILNCSHTHIFLISEQQKNLELPLTIFETYISEGYIKGLLTDEMNQHEDDERKQIISQASKDELKIANERYEVVLRFLNKEKIDDVQVDERTIRNWVRKYQNAEELYGHGFIGLIPQKKKRGNRKAKINQDILELMDKVISESFETIKLKTRSAVYGELLVRCEEKNLEPVSFPTFCKHIKNRSLYETTLKRKGRRSAYKYEEFYFELESTTPRHGDRVFEIAHIDHTELDIELVVGKDCYRPWLTIMVDAYSRRILAFYLTFEEPSYRSCMMVLRECVKNHNRLPNNIVVDGGKEFNSEYFETLLAMCGVHKKSRPPAKARFGNVVERIFGIANKFLIHNLQGNTQIMKDVRQVTKSVNPKNHAVWTLELLQERFGKWVSEIYDNKENPSLNQTPKEAYEESLLTGGNRPNKYIPYDESFIMMTLPSPDRRTRRVYPGKGIKLTYSYYWSPKFRNPRIEDTYVEVKYDPFNVGIAYVYIENKWEKCYSEHYQHLNGKTEKQIKLITEELRRKKKGNAQKRMISAKEIARFILDSEDVEDRLALERYKTSEIKHDIKIVRSADLEVQDISKERKDEDIIDIDKLEIFGESL
ncbi:TnsA endonuclease N-terminal domain-containing protein [Bacillaceae bacterium CLA-AA-H227]|uniref:TnsA endonuclease N-terminal domain-containing protein n=1 Tax=Robertmurraya yapensis (ex Hitch et al 2024) TaxID=3133160 RepID=A0ACC6SFR0_9BACI